jgi:hypothetical protein
MELMKGGKPEKEPSEQDVTEMMALTNEIIMFVNRQKYPNPMWRVRALAMAFGRVMGSTANNRIALTRHINEQLEIAREGAFLHMKQREDGVVGPRPVT